MPKYSSLFIKICDIHTTISKFTSYSKFHHLQWLHCKVGLFGMLHPLMCFHFTLLRKVDVAVFTLVNFHIEVTSFVSSFVLYVTSQPCVCCETFLALFTFIIIDVWMNSFGMNFQIFKMLKFSSTVFAIEHQIIQDSLHSLILIGLILKCLRMGGC